MSAEGEQVEKDKSTPKNIGHMTENALKRKERLMSLKRKANNNVPDAENLTENKKLFRNYESEDPDIVTERAEPGCVENEVKGQLESMKTPIVIDEIDIANLAPRKPDWDLKRDVAKKLEVLERRTQKAIAELIRERLKAGKDPEDFLQAVNAAAERANDKSDEED
ncbi:coiled-coil domain-containing protein 12 [Phlebotomus argentipes]|uniref:coiled-coil domain-containing protein 12 n=1 Tax=Phlebotomus argentipes TaxID=94469 RepID=UPI002892CC2F|nr:coiled-coil domain-containing protein 12 [Phlebotomus argentipes]